MLKDKYNLLLLAVIIISIINMTVNMPMWLLTILFAAAAVCLVIYWLHILKPAKKQKRKSPTQSVHRKNDK